MRIEYLYWEDCPSHEAGLDRLQDILTETGISADLTIRAVNTEEAALAERFIGSPTIRVNGIDIDPSSADGESALSCRVYRHENGRYSPLPSVDTIKRALEAARSS